MEENFMFLNPIKFFASFDTRLIHIVEKIFLLLYKLYSA